MASKDSAGDDQFESWFDLPPLDRNQRILTALLVVAIVGLAAALTNATLFKWGDPITDLGVEFSVAEKLTQGHVLYRDLTYPYGPLSPYLNALLMKVFGNQISSILIGSFVSVVVGGILVFRSAKHFVPAPLAVLILLPFLLESVFGHYYINGTFGFVLPYSFSAVHAILLGLAAVERAITYTRTPRRSDLLWAGVLTGLATLCKLEIAAAALLSIVLGISVLRVREGDRSSSLKAMLAFLLPAALTAGFGLLPFLLVTSPEVLFSQNLFQSSMADPTKNIFQVGIAGMDQPLENLKVALKSLGFWLVFPLTAWMAFKIFKQGTRGTLPARVGWAVLGTVPSAALAWFGAQKLGAFVVFKGLPLLLLLVVVVVASRTIRSRSSSAGEIGFGILSSFALFCLARILLNVGMFHYGFFMALPALVLLPIVLSYLVFVTFRETRSSTYYIRSLACLVVITISASAFVKSSLPTWKLKETELSGPGGKMKAIPTALNQYLAAGMEYMDQVMDSNGSLVVIPEGAMLNFLFRRQNPTRYGSFMPHIVANSEHDVAEEFRRTKPDYVLLVDRKLDEFGSAGPGKDYLLELMEEVHATYDTLAGAGPVPYTHEQGGWLLFQRRDR